MLDSLLNGANRWALQTFSRDWVDYLVSNTMTEFNRRINPFVWSYQLQALLLAVHDEADGVKTFVLLPNQHWRDWQAGQHAEFVVEINGAQHRRYYSLAQRENGCVSITVKRVADGLVSNWIHQHWQPGKVIRLGLPQGSFVYRQQPKLLFICAGSGITPCHSIAQALLQQGVVVDMAFDAQFRHETDMIFASSLRDWAREEGLNTNIALSQPRQSCANVVKPLDADELRRRYPDFAGRDIYLCGPQGFMDKTIALLQQAGFDLARLHCERFAGGTWEADAGVGEACEEIVFQHLNQRVQLDTEDAGKTLMQIAERHHVPLEIGCRQGMCGTCKLMLRQGKVSGNTLGNAVYLCSAYPASRRVVLDA
jgi:ferredoxin-NADP reductase